MNPLEPNERKGMSRGEIRAWILAALVIVVATIAYFATRLDPSDPYAKCQKIIGYDLKCRSDIAVRHLLSR